MRILLLCVLLLPVAARAAGESDPGKTLFEQVWVAAPSSLDAVDGLGPLYNETSCAACHAGPGLGAEFRVAPDGKIAATGLIARLGDGQGRPDPVYGAQLQNRAVPGLRPEGHLVLDSPDQAGAPFHVGLELDRGALAPATHLSLRRAPWLLGRGALARIDEAAVRALADPDDRDGDGISGRPRLVEEGGATRLGRFGWKAAEPDIADQAADAFSRDLGLSSPLVPSPTGDCTSAEPDCLAAPNGESPATDGKEVPSATLDAIAAYVASLDAATPALDPAGLSLFKSAGCAACHVPAMPATGGGMVTVFTDLLLHDMGPGLDDGVGEPGAASAEWRTAPLLGLHLVPRATRRFLHDGRAASLDAAIAAHGGEAAASRDRYAALPAADRARLVAFLESL